MPRIHPLQLSEQNICARFREARCRSGIKQAELARRIGIHPDRLAGYEHARNPFPYWVGAQIAEQTGSCQRWLATGAPPSNLFVPVAPVVADAVPTNVPFSIAYFVLLGPEIENLLKHAALSSRRPIEELEMQDLRGWAPIYSSPTEELQATCVHFLKIGMMLSHALPAVDLAKFTEELQRNIDDHSNAAKLSERRASDAAARLKLKVKIQEWLGAGVERLLGKAVAPIESASPAKADKQKPSRTTKK